MENKAVSRLMRVGIFAAGLIAAVIGWLAVDMVRVHTELAEVRVKVANMYHTIDELNQNNKALDQRLRNIERDVAWIKARLKISDPPFTTTMDEKISDALRRFYAIE